MYSAIINFPKGDIGDIVCELIAKLWMKNCARGVKNNGIRIGSSSDKIAENVGGDHGVGHATFVKSRCNEHVGRGFCALTAALLRNEIQKLF